jgi:hypothetical protein
VARLIGEAYIVIYPQGDQFGPQAKAIVEKGLSAVKGSVPVTPNLDQAGVAKVESQLKTLGQNIDMDAVVSAASLVRIKAQLDAITENVQVGAELNPARVASIQAQLKAISDNLQLGVALNPVDLARVEAELKVIGTDLPLGVTVSPGELTALRAELDAALHNLDIGLATGGNLPAEIAALRARIEAILNQVPVGVSISPAQLAAMKASFDAYMRNETIPVNAAFNAASLAAAKAGFSAYMAANPVSVNVSTSAAMAQIAALAAYTKAALANAGNLSLNWAGAIAQAVTLKAAIASINSTFSAMAGTSTAAGTALTVMGVATNSLARAFITMVNGGGAWGVLTSRITLFAGAFNQILPEILSSVSVWHLATDWVLEFAAVLVPATLALTAWGGVMAFVVADALTKFQAVATVATVTGEKIGSFNANLKGGIGPLQSLQNYLNPTVWELYGDAITVADSKTGAFTSIVKSVNTVVQDLAARMTEAFSSTGFQTFMQNGALDFQRFGTIIGNLGGAFGNFVKDVPGYAEIIEELFEKITAGIEAFTAFAGPVIKAGLALHGFLLYVGLALTAGVSLVAGIGNVTAKFFTFAASAVDIGSIGTTISTAFVNAGAAVAAFGSRLALLLANPYVLAIAAIGLAAYAIVSNWDKATASVNTFVSTMNTKLASMTGGQALQQIAIDFGQVTTAIKQAASPAAYQQINANWANLSNWGNQVSKTFQVAGNDFSAAFHAITTSANPVAGLLNGVEDAAKGLWTALVGGGQGQSVALQVQENIGTLENAYKQLSAQQQNLLTVTGALMLGQEKGSDTTFTWSQSLGILDAAGVQASDSLQTMQTKVQGLLQGWQTLGLTGGQVGSAVNALTFDVQLGQTGVTKMTQAYSNFISTLTGGETAFTTFGTGLQTIVQSLSSAGAKGVTFNDSLDQISVKGTAAGATMNGLSQASLNVRGAFATEITNATNLYNSLLTLATVSDAGAKGQGLLAQAGKDMVATLLPLAKGSSTAMAEVSGLAQIAGGPATTSFQALSKWVGNVQSPMQQLNKIEGQLTTSSVNLEKDANNLAGAFGVTLNNAISGALFAAEKGPQALQGLANALQALATGSGSATTVENALKQLIPALTLMTGSGKNAESEFLAMAGALHISQGAATAMWNAVAPGGAVLSVAAAQSLALSNAIKTLPGNLNANVAAIKQTDVGLQGNIGYTNLAKQAFISFAQQGLHLSLTSAQSLWSELNVQNLVATAGRASSTEAQFTTLAKSFNLTTTQAQAMWTQLRLQYLDTLATKAGASESQFVALAKSGLDLTTTAAQNLWTAMREQYLDTLATKANATYQQFVTLAKQLGVSSTAAVGLWTSLKQLPPSVGIAINETISGGGTIQVQGNIVANTTTGVATSTVTGEQTFNGYAYASGGTVGGVIGGSGPSGRDSQLIMAAPGELIVPAAHAPKFADMARRASIPGFASGGVIGGPQVESMNTQIVPGTRNVSETVVDKMGATIVAAAKTFAAGGVVGGVLPTIGASVNSQVVQVLAQALAATQTPLSWLPALEQLVMKSSSGNASAVNPVTGARGLFGLMPANFSAFALPGAGGNIGSPFANAVAAIRYIKAEYGSPAGITGIGKPGTYHGFSAGGTVSEPVFGYGKFSGMPYSFAENGPEYVGPISGNGAGSAGMPPFNQYQGQQLIQLLQQQNKLLAQMPYSQASAIGQANAAGVRRGYFATSG